MGIIQWFNYSGGIVLLLSILCFSADLTQLGNNKSISQVAMKVIDTHKIKDEYVRKNILREALLLKKLNHPNIVRLYETLKQHSIYCIVTEYVPGGELLSYLRRQNESKLSESQARPIMRQLISALYHMHQSGIVHR